MNENQVTIFTRENTISSREVAEAMEVRHDSLLRKIDKLNSILNNTNLWASKYWYETTYKQARNGKECREYQVTKKGCELIAHNTEGEKGVVFTVRYMDKFEEMEKKLQKQLPGTYIEALEQLLASEKEKERLALENREQLQIIEELQPKADYNLVKVADVDIYELDSNYEDFKYSVKNIKIDKSVEEFKESADNKIYFLSEKNMGNQILQPRIPDNYFTKNGYEDKTTKRVCFSKSIDGSLMGLERRYPGQEYYVHVPSDDTSYYSPSTAEVPDSKITKEVWVKNPVKVKCIGKIHVLKDKGLKGHKFKYGDKVAELYDWEWKWVEKESTITESTLKTKDRNKLDDSEFGLPELRKYPLNDKCRC